MRRVAVGPRLADDRSAPVGSAARNMLDFDHWCQEDRAP
jgi:hypothetical protein